MRPHFSAVFDSPDRLFGSGGHVMGILFPGSTGENRQEGSLLPRVAEKLAPGGELVLRATLLGGRGQSIRLFANEIFQIVLRRFGSVTVERTV
jgi:hypothetical protein